MLQLGYASASARSGVDVNRLADAAQCSYEMARRYAEGVAVPRPDKLRAIADWLGVSTSELAWGEASPNKINQQVLEQCLKAVIDAQKRTGRTLTNEQASHAVATLYSEAMDGRFPAEASIDLMLRAAV